MPIKNNRLEDQIHAVVRIAATINAVAVLLKISLTEAYRLLVE